MRPKANLVVLDPGSGKARPGAFVTLYQANTLTKAALYADDDISPIGNPVQANGLGQVSVRLNPGLYDVSMTWDGAMPTVVEDVSLVSSEQIIASPGDIVIGDVDGSPIRLAVGANGQTLVVEDGLPKWVTLGSGHGLPVGGNGSLLSYGPTGAVLPILPGLQDQALAMQGGRPEWVSTLLPPGTTLPINQPGDLVVGQVTTGAVARLPRGQTGEVLITEDTGGLAWSASTSIARGGGDGFLGSTTGGGGEGWLLHFLPYRGTNIWVDNRARVIPAAGLTLAPTGLAADTTYFIYAAWVASALVLEASTTRYRYTDGLVHKEGDETRTLVGMARTSPGATPTWVYSERQRFIMSFFHAGAVAASSFFTAPRFITEPSGGEVHPEIRTEFLAWEGATILFGLSGMVITSDATPCNLNTYLLLNGATTVAGHAVTLNAGQYVNIAATRALTFVPLGFNYVTLGAAIATAGGTVGWHGEPSGTLATRVSVLVGGAGN